MTVLYSIKGREQMHEEDWKLHRAGCGHKMLGVCKRAYTNYWLDVVYSGWVSDESGYDERTWPIVKSAIEDNRLSNRSRLHESSK